MSRQPKESVRQSIFNLIQMAKDCEQSGKPISKTELVKRCNESNYAYTLGMINTLVQLGYLRELNHQITVNRSGVSFLWEIPF